MKEDEEEEDKFISIAFYFPSTSAKRQLKAKDRY